jgi:hypothetical protein
VPGRQDSQDDGQLVNDGETLLYLASTHDCKACPLKARCTPKMPARRIPRSIYEDARDVARALAKTEAFEQSCRDRKRVEMLFAHLKRILRLGRLRLRGPRGAHAPFQRVAVNEMQAAMPALMRMAPALANYSVNGFEVRAETAAAAAKILQKEQRAAKRLLTGNDGWITEVRPAKAVTS